jgi:hypothetical protein
MTLSADTFALLTLGGSLARAAYPEIDELGIE